MKKKTKLLIALLLVFVGVGLTYAVYTTSVGGNANVTAANWLIKVKTGSNFDNQNGIDVSGGATDINLGSCQKLAPGGSCTLPFRVDATGTEVDTILTVELGNNVSGATLEELTNAGINLKISDGVNEDYAYLLNMGSYKDLNLVINWEAGDEDDDIKAGYDVSIANKLAEITIPVNMIVKQRTSAVRTVTFNTHDSNIETPESIQVNDGETISNIPSLSKNGYIFVGWFTSENGGVQLTSSTPIIENIEYHARFREPQNVTVSFNTHGGSNVNSVNVLEGGTLSELPSSPTKLGYTFAGWYTAETGGEAVTTSTVINNTIEFHAQWTIKYVTITFESNGGSSVTSPVQVQEGSVINPLPTTAKSGSEFMGWFDSNNNQLTTATQIMGDITYTARWYDAYTYAGELVYFDPVTANTCNPLTFSMAKILNGTSTCYKWREIKEVNNTVTLQLDHNLINTTSWGTNTTNGPTAILTSLATQTKTWSRVSNLNGDIYDTTAAGSNYGIMKCTDGVCKKNGETLIAGTSEEPVKARLITGEEVSSIVAKVYPNTVNIVNWSLSNSNTYAFGNAELAWLVENTRAEGYYATANQYGDPNYGYWTMSPTNSSSYAYMVDRSPQLISSSGGDITQAGYRGARPVIEVSKSMLVYDKDFDVNAYRIINFLSNGANEIQPIIFNAGQSYTITQSPYVEKTNYEFLGWYDENDNKITFPAVITDSVILTAKWVKVAYSLGELVYYDPVSSNTCSSSTYTGSGTCYKWRIIGIPDSSNCTIQLDRNLNNTRGTAFNNIMSVLSTQTSTWGRPDLLDFDYDTTATGKNGSVHCSGGNCTTPSGNLSGVRARIITGEEIAAIMNNTTWSQSNQSTITNLESYLRENISGSDYGYWSLTPSTSSSNPGYYVYSNGSYQNVTLGSAASYIGLRPVITVSKTDLN